MEDFVLEELRKYAENQGLTTITGRPIYNPRKVKDGYEFDTVIVAPAVGQVWVVVPVSEEDVLEFRISERIDAAEKNYGLPPVEPVEPVEDVKEPVEVHGNAESTEPEIVSRPNAKRGRKAGT